MPRSSVPAALCRSEPVPLSEKLTWSLDDAGRATGLSSRLLQQYIARGELKAIRVGRRILLSPDTLKLWLASLESTSLHGDFVDEPNDK